MIRAASFVIFVAIGISQLASPCVAQQQDPARRREFIQGLLKTFIDSQVPTEAGRPAVQRNRPNQPNQPASEPNQQRAADSPELRRAGEMLTAASNEMSMLVDALQGDIYRAQGVRQLLTLAFHVNADAASLSRQLSYASDVEALRVPLRKLDQDWRALDFRLSQTPNLSATTLGHIQKIQQLQNQLASMFQVQTQVDMNALSQRSSQMNQALRTLLQDIRYEVTDDRLADNLFQAGRSTYEQLQRFIQLTRPNPGTNVRYESLKQEYELLEREWSTYQQKLRQANNRYVQRQTQLINDDIREMNQLLYISNGQVNREDLVYTTRILRGDIDRLLQRINLKMLTELPVAQRYAIEAAGDLDQTCNDFAGLLDDDLDNIQDMFLYMFDEWQRLSLALQGVQSQEARQSMRDVERSLAGMQSKLGVRLDLDRNAALELAGTLTGDARHLQEDVRDVFSRPNRYPRDFQTSCLKVAAEFEASTREVNDGLERGEKLQSLASRTQTLSVAWNALSQMLTRFAAGDGAHLAKIQRDITPQVIRLQTLLSP